MARLFVPPERLTGERATIDGDGFRHLVKVLRLAAGDDLLVFDGAGTEIQARIISVGGRSAEVALGERRAVPGPRVPVTLLQTLPRGDRMDFIIQKATELGVARIVPLVGGRTQVRPPAERQKRWETIAREAARQSGRADLPSVNAPLPFEQGVAMATEGTRLVLFEGEKALPLRRALSGEETSVAVLIGPEGGLEATEVQTAERHGFRAVGLGPRILRVETAAVVGLALVQAAVGALE